MPLNTKGKKIKKDMEKRYGKKKGQSIFYAMENSGKLKGVKKRKIPEVNKKNFPYPLVRIYWEDIIGETNWSDIVDIKKSKTAICCSVGWLINENSTTTVVMADFSFEDNGDIKQGGNYTTIPTKNVLTIKKLKI